MKSFAEVAAYARTRAVKSAKRNDPQAWAYWLGTARWAHDVSLRAEVERPIVAAAVGEAEFLLELARLDREAGVRKNDPRAAADAYSRIKWCRVILRAHGRRVGRLSLEWLRAPDPWGLGFGVDGVPAEEAAS